jgi:hypothetical protein
MQGAKKLPSVECRGRENGVPHDTPRGKPNTRKPKGETHFPEGDITRRYTCAAWVTMSRPYNTHYVKWLPFGFLFCARLSSWGAI